jgi:cobalamin biosynthesis Co2+ chelatase CbiK
LSFHFISTDKKKTIANYQEEIAALKTARALVSVLHHSTQMLDKLKDIQVQRNIDENALGLVNGFVTRWWNTYDMLEQMLNLKSLIQQLYYEELEEDNMI